jgi:hypothetical protein
MKYLKQMVYILKNGYQQDLKIMHTSYLMVKQIARLRVLL